MNNQPIASPPEPATRQLGKSVLNTLALSAVLATATISAARADSLFVRIDDLSPPGDTTYEGADIEAIELLAPGGTAAYYAAAVVASEKPENANNAEIDADTVIGQPVLIDWDVPYVFSMNGGWVIAEVPVAAESPGDGWRLTVYEVDGSLFSWGDGPEPYRVSIADSADGPWRPLGTGSGTARFRLGSGSEQTFDDERFENIRTVLEEALDNEPMTEKQRTEIAPFLARIGTVDDIAQLQTELVGLHTFFNYTEHVVNEHGEQDGGRVMRARALLQAAWTRYRGITGS